MDSELFRYEHDAITARIEAEQRRGMWAVVLGLTPKRFAGRWCVHWGKDLQAGVSAFGSTPELALKAFERAMGEEMGKAEEGVDGHD